jgi:flagellar basal-body rod protein FlgB
MSIFSAVSSHMSWLQNRHLVVSGNIANANTPGFKAMEISAFGKTLDAISQPLQATDARHFAGGGASRSYEIVPQRNLDVSHSGNDVMIEKEMRRLGENVRGMSYDTNVARAFHRMILQSVKA